MVTVDNQNATPEATEATESFITIPGTLTIGKGKNAVKIEYVCSGNVSDHFEDGDEGRDRQTWKKIQTLAKAAMKLAKVQTNEAAQAILDGIVVAAPKATGAKRPTTIVVADLDDSERNELEGLSPALLARMNVKLA